MIEDKKEKEMKKCSRLEVITLNGREVVLYGDIEYSVEEQDNGETVKIFVKVDESTKKEIKTSMVEGIKKTFSNIFKQE